MANMKSTPSRMDIIAAALIGFRILLLGFPLFLVTMLYHEVSGQKHRYNNLTLGQCIEIFFIRSITESMPVNIMRVLSDIGLPESVLNSKRYGQYAKNLFQPVIEEGFRGVWVVKGGFEMSAIDAKDSDIVIYYLHGGGYFNSSPATYLCFLLILAEAIVRGGKTVSIFALEYDLAPEATFPTQLIQARKGYEWLLRSVERGGAGVSKEKVLLMGDSAGGHLCLSLLVDLWKPYAERSKLAEKNQVNKRCGEQDLRPGVGLVLISPWLSLYHVPDSFERNALTDVLSKDFLARTARRFLGPENSVTTTTEKAPWMEFLGDTDIVWDEVLPDWVWVSAGRNEILYDDIVKWFCDRETDCHSRTRVDRRIQCELNKHEAHVYPMLKTWDQGLRKKFCEVKMQGERAIEQFNSTKRIGDAILKRLEVANTKAKRQEREA